MGVERFGAPPPTGIRPNNAGYAASITPDVDRFDMYNIGALTGNLVLENPIGTKTDGRELRFRLLQDAVGGRTVTFGTDYAFGTDVTTAMIPTGASAKWEMLFIWHAPTSKWRATEITRGF